MAALLSAAFSLHAAEPVKCVPLRPVTGQNIPFKPGEELVYDIHCKVGVINANVAKGYLTIDTTRINGVPVYKSNMTGKVAKFYNAFFKIREDFTAWLRADDLKPLRFERDTREGGYFAMDQYVYNWGENPYIDADLNSKNKGQRNMLLPLNECTFDIITLFCRMRNVDISRLKENDHFVMSFVLGSKAKKANLVYLGTEVLELKNYGEVNTFKFCMVQDDPEVQEVNEDSDSNMYMWFSADDNRIPVSFIAPAKFGLITGRLNTCSGLKYPFAGN